MFSARFARRAASFSSFFAFASARFRAFLPRAAPAVALSLSGVSGVSGVPISPPSSEESAAPEEPPGANGRASAAAAGVLPLRSASEPSGDDVFDAPAAPFALVSPTGRANVLCPCAI